jgi:EmrB/QacA subfamily drug resistance transporter
MDLGHPGAGRGNSPGLRGPGVRRHIAPRDSEAGHSEPEDKHSKLGGSEAGHSEPGADPRTVSRGWSVLVLLSAAQFMVVLDMTVVNVALPSIGRALSIGPGGLQWVITTYLLFTGGLMLLGGRAADLVGRRRIFGVGLAIFTIASLTAGLATSSGALIAARGAQGLGAALLSPAALSIITAGYSGAQRGKALAAWGALGASGAAVGVLAGGLLTSALGWRSVFLINVPIGLVVGILAPRMTAPLAAAADQRGGRKLDLPGALLAVAALAAVILALAGTTTAGWGSARTVVLLSVGAALLAAFAAVERRAASPLVPLLIVRSRPLAAGTAVMLGATGVLVAAFYLNTLYLQDVLGESPLVTGAEFLPMVLAIGTAAHLAGRLLPRAGARWLAVTGLALMGGGGLLLAQATPAAGWAGGVLAGMLVIGLGVGLVFPAAMVAAMSNVVAGQEGLASGLMTTAHEVGAALGVAVFATVAAGAAAGLTAAAGVGAGYRHGFVVAAAVAGALAIVALLTVPSARPRPGMRLGPH